MTEWLNKIKIRYALIAIITVSLLTLSITSIVLNNMMFTNVFEKSVESDLLPNQLAKVKARIKHQLSTPLELSKSITQNTFLVDWSMKGEPESFQPQVIQYLKDIKEANDAFVVFWVSNVTKDYLNHNGKLKTITPESDQWFYQFMDSSKPFEIAFDFEEGSSELTAFVNYRVAKNGQNLAVAGLGYSVNQISKDILTNKIGESGYVFVSDMQGKIIIHPNLSALKQNQLRQLKGFSRSSDRLLQTSDNYVFDVIKHEEEYFYVASVGIPELGWKIIAMLPVAEPMSKVHSALISTGVMNLIIAILFILLMIALANRITKPIVDIGDRLSEMAQHGGDLTHKLDEKRNNELGVLASGFNAILGKVCDIMVEIKQTETVMTTSFEQLQQMAEEVDDCVRAQQLESDSVATATTEMNQSIQEVSDLAGNTATKTEHTQSEVQKTNQQVTETSFVMQQLQDSNLATQQQIEDLASQTQTINSVIDVISAISEQTNLLALNAAIEAARAGEQGRGFAVVADEVRSLAARTQSSTSEIKDVIEKLQHQAQQTVMAMAKNSELASNGSSKTEMANRKLNIVVEQIGEITDMNTLVATATHEQSNVIGELSINVTKIADMASSVADLSRQTKSVVSELEAQKRNLSSLVSQFKTR